MVVTARIIKRKTVRFIKTKTSVMGWVVRVVTH